jgi:hypothetical protein
VSTTPVANFSTNFASVVDTGGKLIHKINQKQQILVTLSNIKNQEDFLKHIFAGLWHSEPQNPDSNDSKMLHPTTQKRK